MVAIGGHDVSYNVAGHNFSTVQEQETWTDSCCHDHFSEWYTRGKDKFQVRIPAGHHLEHATC